MEQRPSSSDGLQPQELSSACNLPSVFDLTRNGEECLLKASSIEALHVVQPPSWYVSSGTGNGMVLPVDDCVPQPQPNCDQIQSDNAFSNTTVTLSYVSRSHVFSAQNPLSEHSQLYGVPLTKTFSLHPAAYDAGQLVADAGDTPLCVELDQHCLQPITVPVGLAACANSFEFITPAQVVENVAGLCYLQQAHDLSGIQDVESLALETLRSLQQNNPNECKIPLSLDDTQNGAIGTLWEAGSFDGSFPAGHIANAEDQQGNGNPEVLFLISRSEEPVVPSSLAVAVNQDFIRPEVPEPVFTPVASLDEGNDEAKDAFSLPQTAGSPSEEDVNSFSETYNHTRWQEELISEGASDLCHLTTNVEETGLSTVTADAEVALPFDTSTGTSTSPCLQLTGNIVALCKPEQMEQSSDLSEVKEDEAEKQMAPTNRSTNTDSRSGVRAKKDTFIKKELPPRSRRGKRLEAIVQNICPIRFRSRHVLSAKKQGNVKCSSQVDETTRLGLAQDQVSFDHSSNQVVVEVEEVHSEEASTKPNEKTAQLQEKEVGKEEGEVDEETGVTDLNSSESQISTSCSESVSKHLLNRRSPGMLRKPVERKCGKKSKKRQKVSKKPPVRVRKRAPPPTPKTLTKSRTPSKQKTLASSKGSPRAKKVHTPKRKRKKHKGGQSSQIFSPKEPEIKLKYANFKEDKREKRDEVFSPFVHVKLKPYSTCIVINYPEESERGRGKQKQNVPSKFRSGVVPTSPCLQYGRVSAEASQRGALVCCLCGGSANAMDLGDLHGPYYPEGFRPVSKTTANPQELREEDSSDSGEWGESDSSHLANGSNPCVVQSQTSWTRNGHHKLRQAAGLRTYQTWSSEGDISCSPAPKRSRTDSVTDWYSPPIVPLEASEYWLHEDCGIWSAGVFFVRGKLYGLEKAIKIAQETVCSSCLKTGASLGCFFKGCPNKYHYRCAMHSGCVLNDENFSMKCRKHKNKSIKGVSNNEQCSRCPRR